MADTLKFRGLSTVEVNVASVAQREIVLDTELNQVVFGNDNTTIRFYNTTQVDALINAVAGLDGNTGGVESFEQLSDVTFSGLASGDLISYNGTNWVNVAQSSIIPSINSIDDIGDVDTTTTPPTDGQALLWNNAAGEWRPGNVDVEVTGGGFFVVTAERSAAPTTGQYFAFGNGDSADNGLVLTEDVILRSLSVSYEFTQTLVTNGVYEVQVDGVMAIRLNANATSKTVSSPTSSINVSAGSRVTIQCTQGPDAGMNDIGGVVATVMFASEGVVGDQGPQGIQGATGATGATGDGFTGGSYDAGTGVVTFTSDDGLGFSTGDLRGSDGTDGDGFTGGSYDAGTGVITFTSNDGLGFTTGDVRGTQGSQGPAGPAGAGATVSVGTVTTGAAGSSVIVTNSGTATNSVLDFTIPRGDAGADGAGAVDSVNTQTGAVVLDADDIDDTSTTHKFATAAQLSAADSAIQPGEVNPVLFSNQAAFPSASSVHGAIAHSHSDGAMYFAHNGVWNKLANDADLATVATSGAYSDLTGTPTNVSSFTNDSGYLTSTVTTAISSNSDITALTLRTTNDKVVLNENDGQGNANIAFNDASGVAEQDGSFARITSPIDGGTPSIDFEVGTSTAGVANTRNDVMKVRTNSLMIMDGKSITFRSEEGVQGLDDYEEGTWTPAYQGTSGNPTVTYDQRNGTYTKIGQKVTCSGRLRTDSKSGGGGNLRIGGLPFTVANDQGKRGALSIAYAATFSGKNPVGGLPMQNGTQVQLYGVGDSNTASMASMTTAELGTTTNDNNIYFEITYFTSA